MIDFNISTNAQSMTPNFRSDLALEIMRAIFTKLDPQNIICPAVHRSLYLPTLHKASAKEMIPFLEVAIVKTLTFTSRDAAMVLDGSLENTLNSQVDCFDVGALLKNELFIRALVDAFEVGNGFDEDAAEYGFMIGLAGQFPTTEDQVWDLIDDEVNLGGQYRRECSFRLGLFHYLLQDYVVQAQEQTMKTAPSIRRMYMSKKT